MKRARALNGLLAIALVATALTATGDTSPAEELAPTERHARVARVVTNLFEQYHYRRTKIGDDISSEILDRYLDALDGNRMYFLASDVKAFEQYRYTLDDAVRNARIEPVFDIFAVYRQRAHERIAAALDALKSEPDFDIDEDYRFDRSDLLWPATKAELDEIWRRRVKNDALSLVLTEKPWDEIVPILEKRYERVLRRTNQLTADEVFETFMNSYADTLDPHSNYFSPRNSEEYRIQMSLSYEGIGASLQLNEDYVTVLDIIPGGPAAIGGELESQDRITAVGQDGEELVDVIGWRLDDVVQLIRGPGGTTVRLQVLPAGAAPGAAEGLITLKRDRIKLEAQAAQKEIVDVTRGGRNLKVGIINVPSFYQDYSAKQSGDRDFVSTTRDVRRLIKELEEEGMDGLIVDLRGNGGGHLSEARALSGLFIEKGPVVQLRGSGGKVEVLGDPVPDVAYSGPLGVLVDRYSASASEIFAAAIQDYERGVVVGQQTFGKGSVQNLYDLNAYARGDGFGQLTLTIGKYYRVTGESTQLEGVHPDIELPSLVDSSLVGESTREAALNWDEIRPTRYRQHDSLDDEITVLSTSHEQRAALSPDFASLIEQIESVDEVRTRKSVPLNIDKRRNEREKNRLRRLEIENTRRAAHGLDPLETPEDLDEAEPVDVLLSEAAHIVADLALLDPAKPSLADIAASPAKAVVPN